MIIHAVSIHSGGGKVLLDHLLIHHTYGRISHLICDMRYELPLGIDQNILIVRIKPKLLERWKAELALAQIAKENPNQEVFCFSNLPPAFKLKNKVILYLQNALLLPGAPLIADSTKAKLRLTYEKIWLNLFWKNIDEIWVQTPWMKKILDNKFFKKEVFLKPFLPVFPAYQKQPALYDFITVTGSARHKRLPELLDAWEAIKGTPPKLLIITDTPNPETLERLNRLKNKNIDYKVNLSRDELFSVYPQCKNLIITSKLESFCLPIYEARHFGLDVYAVKEFFNEDVISPENFLNFENGKLDLNQFFTKE